MDMVVFPGLISSRAGMLPEGNLPPLALSPLHFTVPFVLALAVYLLVLWMLRRRRNEGDTETGREPSAPQLSIVRPILLACSLVAIAASGWQLYLRWYEVEDALRVALKHSPAHHLAKVEPSFLTGWSPRSPLDDHYLLVTSMFDDENAMRLIDHRGEIVHEWIFDVRELFPESGVDTFGADLHGSLVLPDGSAVANFDYLGLARIDRHGEPVFQLSDFDNGALRFEKTHHSVWLTERGTFWVPAQVRRTRPYKSFSTPVMDELMVEVDDDGNVLRGLSILEIFVENGLEALISRPHVDEEFPDLFHLNDIEELSSDLADAFPLFEAGDLLISLRQPNLVAVVDPDTRAIKWHGKGGWAAQHDPDFEPDGSVSLYDNTGLEHQRGSKASRILRINPVTDEVKEAYRDPGFYSEIRGKHQIRQDGSILIAEFATGRVLLVSPEGRVVFEYANPRGTNWSGQTEYYEITQAELIPHDYFEPPLHGQDTRPEAR